MGLGKLFRYIEGLLYPYILKGRAEEDCSLYQGLCYTDRSLLNRGSTVD